MPCSQTGKLLKIQVLSGQDWRMLSAKYHFGVRPGTPLPVPPHPHPGSLRSTLHSHLGKVTVNRLVEPPYMVEELITWSPAWQIVQYSIKGSCLSRRGKHGPYPTLPAGRSLDATASLVGWPAWYKIAVFSRSKAVPSAHMVACVLKRGAL